ncbi:MAG: methyltransferase [Legionella sp.]|nr:MAG: methyltransferase [Legionella sp.]
MPTAPKTLINLLLSPWNALKNHLRLKQWIKENNLHHHEVAFQEIFKDINGFQVSREARVDTDALEYTYGEIEFLPFIALLSLVTPGKNTVFYDLGSGVGKAVFACALAYPIQKSVGIELFNPLHQHAQKAQKNLLKLGGYEEIANKISFFQGNYLEVDLQEATLIFINSSTIFNPLWENLSKRLENFPQVLTVITTSKPLESTHFSLIRRAQVEMSWGVVMAYIHQRKN